MYEDLQMTNRHKEKMIVTKHRLMSD